MNNACNETIRMVVEFEKWLLGKPEPKSVEDIQKYWKMKRDGLKRKITSLYDDKIAELMGGNKNSKI